VSLQVAQLTGLSSSLTSLALRPQPQEVTLDSIYQLASITQMQDLSLCPLPEGCTAPGLQQLLDMPQLTRLQLGTNDAAQVSFLFWQQASSSSGSCSTRIETSSLQQERKLLYHDHAIKQHQTTVMPMTLNWCTLYASCA
jgi:hypothetical protein